MEFGMFMEFQTRPDGSAASAFSEGFDLVDAAEQWGLDSVWLAEFHFNPTRSVLSSPILIASSIATRTERVRIGMAVYVLPLNHPLRIAEEVATLDHLSGGRFEMGVGRSGFTGFYRAYGISYDESRERFDESMEILRRAWTEETFSYSGAHYEITDARVWPRPVQQPHPPLRVAATTAETFERMGAQGLPIFVGLRGDGLHELRASLDRYRTAWQEAGHPGRGSVLLRVPLYAAADSSTALAEAKDTLTYYFERQSKLVSADAATRENLGASSNSARAQTAAALAALSYEDIVETRAAVGGATALIERLEHWRDALGLDGIVVEPNAGGLLSAEKVRESLRVLTHDVMPAFK